MPKLSNLPSSRRHIMVYDEDWAFLSEHFAKGTEANMGEGVAVRELIHKRVIAMRQAIADKQEEAMARLQREQVGEQKHG